MVALLEESGPNADAVSSMAAVAGADIIVLATPWDATEEILHGAGDLSNKILIDCTNPIAPGLQGLTHGRDISGGEQVAAWAPAARVVKAFNTTGASNMANADYGDEKLAMFYCGDDDGAKAIVHDLVAELGFDPVDSGPLYIARYLEPMAMLWIDRAILQGKGMDFGFRLIQR